MKDFKQLTKSIESITKKKPSRVVTILEDMWFEITYYCWSKPKDIYYWIRNFLLRRYDLIPTGLNKGQWCDKVELILYGMMNLLVDFVEKEKCFEVIAWDSDPEHAHVAKEIHAIYDWWKNYPTREQEISDKLTEWHDAKFEGCGDNWLERLNSNDTPEVKKMFDDLHILEEKLHDEEQEYIKRLIDIRRALWT